MFYKEINVNSKIVKGFMSISVNRSESGIITSASDGVGLVVGLPNVKVGEIVFISVSQNPDSSVEDVSNSFFADRCTSLKKKFVEREVIFTDRFVRGLALNPTSKLVGAGNKVFSINKKFKLLNTAVSRQFSTTSPKKPDEDEGCNPYDIKLSDIPMAAEPMTPPKETPEQRSARRFKECLAEDEAKNKLFAQYDAEYKARKAEEKRVYNLPESRKKRAEEARLKRELELKIERADERFLCCLLVLLIWVLSAILYVVVRVKSGVY